MLDKRTSLLLETINTLCSEGSYKIVEESELLSCFPLKSGDDLKEMLRYLAERGYVDVRYAEEGVYCLCPLPEGRLYAEEVKREQTDDFRRRRETVLFTALGAFLGAFLGSAAVWMIAFLIGGV